MCKIVFCQEIVCCWLDLLGKWSMRCHRRPGDAVMSIQCFELQGFLLQGEKTCCTWERTVCTWEQAYPIKASPLTRFRKNTAQSWHTGPCSVSRGGLQRWVWTPSFIFGCSVRACKGLFLDQVALMWGLHLQSTFSWAWDVSSDVEASCLYVCAVADTAPRSLNLTQALGSDASACGQHFSWKSLKWPVNCERHLGTRAERKLQVHSPVSGSFWDLCPWRKTGAQVPVRRATAATGWLGALCSWLWTAWVQTLAPPLPSYASMGKFLELSGCFLLNEKGITPTSSVIRKIKWVHF